MSKWDFSHRDSCRRVGGWVNYLLELIVVYVMMIPLASKNLRGNQVCLVQVH
jgi:hypothetical protein